MPCPTLTPRSPLGAATLLLSALLCPAASAQVRLEVVANPNPARPGATLDLEFTVTNSGASTLTDLTLEFDWPADLASMYDSVFAGDCASTTCDPGEIASFAIPVLFAGEGLTFSAPPRIHSTTATGTIVPFHARVYDNGILEAQDNTAVVVDGSPVLEFVLTEDRDPVAPGEEIRYTLTYGTLATGPGSPGALLEMPVPPGTSFVSASGGAALQGGVVVWPTEHLSPGESGKERATFRVAPSSSLGSIVMAEAFLSDQAGIPHSSTQVSATRIQNTPALSITLNVGPDAAMPGEFLDMELTVSNTSPFPQSGVVLTFEYPDQMASIYDSTFAGDCASTTCDPGEIATFDVGMIASGESISYSLAPRIQPGTPSGAVTRIEAEVHASSGTTSESATSFAVEASRATDLALAESHDPVAPGDAVTYTLTYGLRATSPGAPNATLRFPMPDGLSFIAATDSGAFAGGVVSWPIGPVNPGDSGEVSVTCVVDPGTPLGSAILLQAELELATASPRILRKQATTRVQPAQDLVVTMTAGPDGARQGETLDLELTVTNSGFLAHSGVRLTLEYPTGLASIYDSMLQGDCPSTTCDPSEIVVFDIGHLPAGEGVSYSIPAIIAGSATGGEIIRFEAEVSDSTGEQYETGANLAIAPTQRLELSVVEDRDPVQPGETVTYTLTYGHLITGSGSPDASLILPVPAGTTFLSSTHGGVAVGGEIRWSLGPLGPGSVGQVRATVLVDSGLGHGSTLMTEASFLGGGSTGQELRYECATRVESLVALELGIAIGRHSARQGEMIDLELTVGNPSPLDRSGVVLTLEYPDSLSSIYDSLFSGDCPSTTCDPRELVQFAIGTLKAGETVTYSMQPRVSNGALNGSVARFEAEVVDSSGRRREAGTAFAISGENDLELSMVENRDALQPGEFATYRMTYGALLTGSGAADATLRFDLPDGTRVAVVSNDGQVVGRSVFWHLGALAPGAGGERAVTLYAEQYLSPGSILTSEAQLLGGDAGDLHSSLTTRIEADSPVYLDMTVGPTSPMPGDTLNVILAVTNSTQLSRTNVVVLLEYPDGMNSLPDGSFGGGCPSTTCDPMERVEWIIPVLAAGETVLLDMAPVVSQSAIAGDVIRFDAVLSDSAGRVTTAGEAVMLGGNLDPATRGDQWRLILGL